MKHIPGGDFSLFRGIGAEGVLLSCIRNGKEPAGSQALRRSDLTPKAASPPQSRMRCEGSGIASVAVNLKFDREPAPVVAVAMPMVMRVEISLTVVVAPVMRVLL